jgi:putative transposase
MINYDTYKRTYSTEFKLAVFLNLVSKDIISNIPRRSFYNFKKYNYDKIYGLQYSHEKLDVAHQIINSNTLYKFNKAVLYIKNTIINIYSASIPDFKSLLKTDLVKQKVVSTINRVKNFFDLSKACRYFNISVKTFHNWSKNNNCIDSVFSKCFKRHPSQLTVKEVNQIKDVLTDPVTKLWPLVSSYYYGLRNKIISMRLRTFYKYANILGLSRLKVPHRRKKHDIGIRASRPNELWHSDLTIHRTQDNVKVFIYIVMDNFSRKILAWKASVKYSAKTTLDCLKEAYEKYILPIPGKPDVKLMVDGGSEVNNSIVDGYLTYEAVSVHKIVAQQDVLFSNSMIEAVNKIIKYNYLFRTDIPDFDSCNRYLSEFIPNYNDRYHCSLGGLSPNEAYSGIIIDKKQIDYQIISARTRRIIENRKYRCPVHQI